MKVYDPELLEVLSPNESSSYDPVVIMGKINEIVHTVNNLIERLAPYKEVDDGIS